MSKYLVPLDGSTLAEVVFPMVVGLVQHMPAPVILLHALEKHPPTTIHGEHHLQGREEAEAYLEEKAQELRQQGVEVEIHVHEGEDESVPQIISEHAGTEPDTLVVMCAHGNGGLRDIFFGSIAQQVLQQGKQPVLILPPHSEHIPDQGNFQRILVPLDGTSAHEPALEVAITFSNIYQAMLHLVLVVPTLNTLQGKDAATSLLQPTAMRAMLDISEESAREYLAGEAARCQIRGVNVETAVLRGNVISSLQQYVKENQVDLVVMASHARTGLDAFFQGSVGPLASEQLTCPLFLQHTSES